MTENLMTENPADPETLIAAERLSEVRGAFKVISREIEKLRGLELGDRHPAVVFRPMRKEPR
jgi:hypothetical protein